MNKLASLFTAAALAWTGAGFAEDNAASAPSDPSAPPDASAAQVTKPKGFMLIQRNIFVPVDAEGNMSSEHAVVIDKQGFVTTEELEAAQSTQGSDGDGDQSGTGKSDGDQPAPKTETPAASMSGSTPSAHKPQRLGEGPMIRS